MKNNKLISLMLALLVCFSLVVTVSATTDNQNLAIAVEANASTVVSANDTVTVSVMINENSGNLGVNFDVKWDPALLEFVGKDFAGSDFEGSTANEQLQFNRVVITVGNPSLGVQFPTMAPKVEGTGLIVKLTFKAKAVTGDTKTSIYIDRESYCDLNGESVENIKTTDLQIVVLDANHQHKSEAAATCTADEVCTYCGFVMNKALGHTWTDATCTEAKTCSVCNATEGNALGHKWFDVIDKEPTMDATGIKHQECKNCGAKRNEGTVVPMLQCAHTWVDATCTTPKTCSACAATEGEALGHAWIDATCTAPKTCSVCNVTEGEALGHTEVVVPGKDATCTETGLTEGKKCSVCDTVILAQSDVAATGHTYGDWTVSKEAKEGVEGEEKRVCSACNIAETRVIAALPVSADYTLYIVIGVVAALALVLIIILVARKKKVEAK